MKFRRLTLRRSDGLVYLDRWGIQFDKAFGIYVHKMSAPDPGKDLHDHPWWFASFILKGGYVERRANTREPFKNERVIRKLFSLRTLRLDECHTIVSLHGDTSWSLVIRGPRVRPWGFYVDDLYMDEPTYDATIRAQRRDLWSDQNKERPW